jgi:uncharacterized protein YggE
MNKSFTIPPLLFVICTFHAQAQSQPQHLTGRSVEGIVVSGECLTKVTQDRGSVTVGSSVTASISKDASEKTIKAHEAIKRAVRDLNLPNFIAETSSYTVQQECAYHEGKRNCQGYRAHLATRFETSDIARLGDIIAIGSSSSADEVSDLSTFASPTSLKAARESCLEVAMKNAAAKAQKLAAGAGIKLGKLLSAVEQGERGLPPIAMAKHFEAAAMSDGVAAAPSVEAKPIDLRVEVTAQYALE